MILDKGGIDKILNSYNPYDEGYTLFLPTNEAIDAFIQQSDKYGSLDDLLNDSVYVNAMCRYHVVTKAYITDDFPFGAFGSETLSGDYLTVSFIAETDTSYYKINNQAPVILPNIKTSNGYIHVVNNTLKPIIYTTYNWLEQNNGYSIFKAAIDTTGFKTQLDVNVKLQINPNPFTLLVEHDSIYHKRNIHSIQDLINFITPINTNYKDPTNPLYNFVAYHVLTGNSFLNNFETRASNYNTYSDVPLLISDEGLYLAINKGKEVFDTLYTGTDTSFIDYIGFNYDGSNILTQSGVIHLIDQVMTQKTPTPQTQYYSFWEEALIREYRQMPAGTYLIDDSLALSNIKYSGTDLYFVTGETSFTSWAKSFLMMNGNFTITYKLPRIVQGKYNVYIRAESRTSTNALILLYIDGKNIGGQINLTAGGVSWDPFYRLNSTNTGEQILGEFNFTKYETHTIYIKSLIPGRFLWENIRFEPVK
jgi:uncharacterized surface protein with fasciclin (FAS1) repeats